MSIKSPETYADYYWKNSVEANAEFDENIESAFAPMFANVLRDVPAIDELPTGLRNFIRSLAEPPSAGFGGFALGVGVEMIDETLHTLMNPMMKMMGRSINRGALETWLTSGEGNTLFRRGKIQENFWELITSSEGYDNINARFKYQSEAPYPSIPDIMLYTRYHDSGKISRDEVWNYFDVPAAEFELWEWLTRQRITTIDAHTLMRRGLIDESRYLLELSKIGWDGQDQPLIKELGWVTPNAMLLMQGDLMQELPKEQILKDISFADINPKYAQNYYDAILTKPASQDIIAYELRRDPELSNLAKRLTQIGIHPAYTDLYKELAYPIPPVADIITMAVREAFTPAIAARFGQYEDLPADYVEWVGKKGLSKEWAERYWAAHWSLPSPMQGFDMLHRGAIDESELDMLLRALDVMPFWRDKLTKIAFRLLSRVDIRRMYQRGVLNEQEVLEAYTELGYNDRDARRMTDFTLKQVLATQSKFTESNVVTAYSQYMITRSEAGSLLRELGVRSENVSIILTSADYKREWSLTNNRIAAVSNLYKKGVYDENKARSELLRLDLPAAQVDVLMEKWYITERDIPVQTWTTAQTLSFMKKGLITQERGRIELRNIGYDTEHIEVYMRSMV